MIDLTEGCKICGHPLIFHIDTKNGDKFCSFHMPMPSMGVKTNE